MPITNMNYSTRVKLGIALIVFVALVPNLWRLKNSISSFHKLPQTDYISQYERRLTGVAYLLPPDQIVAYIDDFIKFPDARCYAFVLAQYSLAPTVLATLDSPCGYIRNTKQVSSRMSRLVLENTHDPRTEPYLLYVFPKEYFEPNSDIIYSTRDTLSHLDQLILLKDFGTGVRLYARGIQ